MLSLGVSIFVEEKNRNTRRPLLANKKIYSGPFLAIRDLSKPMQIRTVNSLSQIINSEFDQGKNCKNYPYKHYKSYRDCDEEYAFNALYKEHKIIPFWATTNLSSVTKLR